MIKVGTCATDGPQSVILSSSTNCYLVKDIIGVGVFGKVARALNMSTTQEVALKILKEGMNAEREIMMHEVVKVLDPVKNNLVHFIETFQDKGQTCLVFERLDMDLYRLVWQQQRPMTLCEIRPIAYQLLKALNALKSIGVVHSDVKPDNVMLVNHQREPYRVKLIDFGVSFLSSLGTLRMIFQPLGYRAPEVSLGLPFSEAIDMWSLGCLLLFLYINNHPFASCEYQTMKALVDLLGMPGDHLLSNGRYTHYYFKKDEHWYDPGWWIKTPHEYHISTGIEPKKDQGIFKTLQDLITLYPVMQGFIELTDRRAFISLIKGLLVMDPDVRLTPKIAMSHPFATMVHLLEDKDSPYFADAQFIMQELGLDKDDQESSSDGAAQEDEASAVSSSGGQSLAVSHSSNKDTSGV